MEFNKTKEIYSVKVNAYKGLENDKPKFNYEKWYEVELVLCDPIYVIVTNTDGEEVLKYITDKEKTTGYGEQQRIGDILDIIENKIKALWKIHENWDE